LLRSLTLSGLAALAVVLGLPCVASSAVAAPAKAAHVHSHSAIPTQHELAGVSCLSPKDCIAVGLNLNAFSHMGGPLAETWNGKAWKAATLSVPKGSIAGQLLAVSCKPAAFCVAVGLTLNAADTGLALAETWNGKTWTPRTLPAIKGTTGTELNGVSCVTAKSCVAVGLAFTKTSVLAMAESWNGKTWTPAAIPSIKGASTALLNGVSCTSAAHCVAAGLYSTPSATFPLIESWNGKAWSRMSAPSPAGAESASLEGVSCGSAKSCVAVGGFRMHGPDVTGFTGVWHGKSWAVVSVPWPKSVFDTSLSGVSCVSATGCVAVGNENGVRKPAAASWNGKQWTVTAVASPPAGKISLFDAVACLTAANCVAAGHQGADMADGTGLSGFWNGKTWRLVLAV